MTEIMMSIKPQWIRRIEALDKRAELRVSRPRQPVPFKVYIYQSDNGGVIGEFICDTIEAAIGSGINREFLENTCVTCAEAQQYAGGKTLFKWYIRSLYLYQKPRPLSRYGLDRPPMSWCYIRRED